MSICKPYECEHYSKHSILFILCLLSFLYVFVCCYIKALLHQHIFPSSFYKPSFFSCVLISFMCAGFSWACFGTMRVQALVWEVSSISLLVHVFSSNSCHAPHAIPSTCPLYVTAVLCHYYTPWLPVILTTMYTFSSSHAFPTASHYTHLAVCLAFLLPWANLLPCSFSLFSGKRLSLYHSPYCLYTCSSSLSLYHHHFLITHTQHILFLYATSFSFPFPHTHI